MTPLPPHLPNIILCLKCAGGGKDVSGSGHLTAAQDLSALGRTLGEGLIAADLSALVVHKRMRAAVGGRASSSSSVAGDLSTATELPSPSSHTAWHWPPDLFLRAAHRPSWGATSAASTATPPLSAKGAAAGSELRAVTLKCLILEVLLQLEGLGLSRYAPSPFVFPSCALAPAPVQTRSLFHSFICCA
jgi:hypothetical protein